MHILNLIFNHFICFIIWLSFVFNISSLMLEPDKNALKRALILDLIIFTGGILVIWWQWQSVFWGYVALLTATIFALPIGKRIFKKKQE